MHVAEHRETEQNAGHVDHDERALLHEATSTSGCSGRRS
jgi:hypothetical protein